MTKVLGWVVLGLGMTGAPARVHVLAGPVVLRHLPPVAAKVDAMPVVVAGSGVGEESAARINAALRRLDARVRTAAAECVRDGKKDGDWQRTVEVTMLGPRYLALSATDDFYCGGAHPDVTYLPLVYDLATGGTVNWLKLLPPGATSGVDEGADGSKVGAVMWPALTALARGQAEVDCRDAFDSADGVPFVLSLDARAGAIEARPSSFPHAMVVCAGPVVIPVEQARKMGGFSGELLDALEAARGLQR